MNITPSRINNFGTASTTVTTQNEKPSLYIYKTVLAENRKHNITDPGLIFDAKRIKTGEKCLKQIIDERLERIPAGQRQMFQKAFGLNGYRKLTEYEIAAERGIPWRRVRMWVHLAMRSLRKDKKFISSIRKFL